MFNVYQLLATNTVMLTGVVALRERDIIKIVHYSDPHLNTRLKLHGIQITIQITDHSFIEQLLTIPIPNQSVSDPRCSHISRGSQECDTAKQIACKQ